MKTKMVRAICAGALVLMPMAALAQSSDAQTPGQQFMATWDLNGDGRATLDELKEMRADVFASFDSNEDGQLDAEEHAVFDSARANDVSNYQGKQRAQMQKMADGMSMKATDADGNGRVSLEEFQASTAKWFAMLDKNGDGAITMADFGKPPAQ
jgi:Ca2+-binding EF-hand superfamily protein